MKLLEKNGLKYLTGMFWQIPDEGKRAINVSKLIKETKMNFCCKIKKIKLTYGFCAKNDLGDNKKVASLAQYIVECSNVSEKTEDSIICFKFKNAGELDENNQPLEQSQYGYVVFMNGTICPDDGEYVSDITMLRIAILKKLKKHNINILHLPFDVATELLNIYEQLSVSFDDDEMLLSLIFNSSFNNIEPLYQLIKTNSDLEQKFGGLLKSRAIIRYQANSDSFDEQQVEARRHERHDDVFLDKIDYGEYKPSTQYEGKSADVITIRKLIKNYKFIQQMTDTRQTRDDLTIIAEYIYAFPIDSNEIYWQNPKLKANYAKALIQPLSSTAGKSVRYGIFAAVALGVVFGGHYLTAAEKIMDDPITEEAKPIVPMAIAPEQLIKACILNNDKYFAPSDFVLQQIKCNSMGSTLTFNTPENTTLSQFIAFAGGNKSVLLNGKVGTITKQQLIQPGIFKSAARDVVISNLQNAALNYSMKVGLPSDATTRNFTINSKLSPVYLFNHGVLKNVRLLDISMVLDLQTGSYTWTIIGEI